MTESKEYQDLMGSSNVDLEPQEVDSSGIRASLTQRIKAAEIIYEAWIRFSMRRTFQWLKENVRKSEQSIGADILKRLNPNEAQLLRDPTSNVRIRFRFGGESFPPIVMYKIFSRGSNIHYFSGRRIIQVGSQATMDAFNVMGVKRYHEGVILEERYQKTYGVYEPYQVGNKMEFVQYLNSLDERPAHLGGRNNGWRELAGSFSAQSVQYDIQFRKSINVPRFKNITRILIRTRHRSSYIKPGGKPVIRSRSSSRATQNLSNDTAEFEDEIGMLFEWANHLSMDHLDDYVFA